jgi:rhodanese-related sulfurtransferase
LLAGYETTSIERLPKGEAPTILTAELHRMVSAKEDFVLVDIRIPSQIKEKVAHPRLLTITLDDLPEQYTRIPAGSKIVVLDLNGRRSPLAARYLLSKGFSDVVKVNGGIRQWIQEGLPVVGAK